MGLYKHKNTKAWWCRFQIAGHEIRRSCRTTDRRRAEVEERRLRAYFESQAPNRRSGRTIGIADLAGLDIERAVAQGVSNRQIEALRYAWGKIVSVLGPDMHPAGVVYDAVQRYIATRRTQGARGQSIVRETYALRRGLREAHRRGELPALPMEWPRVKRDPPNLKQKGKLHPPAIIAAWLGALEGNARDEAEIAVLTSLRATELRRITAQWIEPAPPGSGVRAVLRVPATMAKNRREAVLPLLPRALAILKRRAMTVPVDAPLFMGSHKRAYRTAAKKIGYEGRITLRDLRHTFGTLAARIGADAARDMLRHQNISTTNAYVSTDIARLAHVAMTVAGTVESAQIGKNRLLWSGRPDSNRRPPAPKAGLVEAINHLSECGACLDAALGRMKMHVVAEDVGTGESAQVAGGRSDGGAA